jgi:cell cycle checkpoint control protein RAD9A
MSLGMELRFTDPAAPLFIDVEGDCSEALFVISTSQVSSAGASASSHRRNVNTKKREREETLGKATKIKRPMRVVQPSLAMERDQPIANPEPRSCVPSSAVCQEFRQTDMPPPSSFPGHSSFMEKAHEPLFLPSSSQLSAADEAVLRASGLEVGTMDELTEMLEGEGEEVTFGFTSQPPDLGERRGCQANAEERFEIIDETELEATQSSYDSSKVWATQFPADIMHDQNCTSDVPTSV